MKHILQIAAILGCVAVLVQGHGYLLDPPARGTAWRKGFSTPRDYNDNAMYCGGKGPQHNQRNGGRCGVCGEEYISTSKRLEPGPANKYATGTIVGNYRQGQTIDVTVMATAFHKGYYEFRLCQNNIPQKGSDSSIAVTLDCLNKNVLINAKTGTTKFIATPLKSVHQVKLPHGVSCSACVFQWRYRTGNSWGCENGNCGVGLGPQEEFYGCSDIAIAGSSGQAPAPRPTIPARKPATSRPVTTRKYPEKTIWVRATTRKPIPKQLAVQKPVAQWGGRKVCRGVHPYGSSVDAYCDRNCNHVIPFCPVTHCKCE